LWLKRLQPNYMLRVNSIALPHYRHLPGKNERPDTSELDNVIAQASAHTTDSSAAENIAWWYGLRLIDHGFYWEAHEVLEAVWNRAAPNSRERHMVQALIQLANTKLKVILQQPKAAARLAQLADDCVNRAFAAQLGREREQLMGVPRSALQSTIAHAQQPDQITSLRT